MNNIIMYEIYLKEDVTHKKVNIKDLSEEELVDFIKFIENELKIKKDKKIMYYFYKKIHQSPFISLKKYNIDEYKDMNCFYIDFPVDITSDTRSKYSDDLDSKSTAFISSDEDKYSKELSYLINDVCCELDFEYEDEVEDFERTEDWDCNDWDDPYFSKGKTQAYIYFKIDDEKYDITLSLDEQLNKYIKIKKVNII